MTIEEKKQWLINQIEQIEDPGLLQSITNLIDQVKAENDLLEADREDDDAALGEALQEIKRNLKTSKLP
jgi:hypothetical protein